jgi:hypothetical protein
MIARSAKIEKRMRVARAAELEELPNLPRVPEMPKIEDNACGGERSPAVFTFDLWQFGNSESEVTNCLRLGPS